MRAQIFLYLCAFGAANVRAALSAREIQEILDRLWGSAATLSNDTDSSYPTMVANRQSANAYAGLLATYGQLIGDGDIKVHLDYIRQRVESAETPEGDYDSNKVSHQKSIFKGVVSDIRKLSDEHRHRLERETELVDQQLRQLLKLAEQKPGAIDDWLKKRVDDADQRLAQIKAETAHYEARRQHLEILEEREQKLRQFGQRFFTRGAVEVEFLGKDDLLAVLPEKAQTAVLASLQNQIVGVVEQDLTFLHRVAENERGVKIAYQPNMRASFRITKAERVKHWFGQSGAQVYGHVSVEIYWGLESEFVRSIPLDFEIDAKGKMLRQNEPDSAQSVLRTFLSKDSQVSYMQAIDRIVKLGEGKIFETLVRQCEKSLGLMPEDSLLLPPKESTPAI